MAIEIIGNKEKAIAIIEVKKNGKKEKELVEWILKNHKNVKTILKKVSGREGELRLKDYEILYGKETEVLHKEYGYELKVDVTKVYFSAREAKERQRIANLVKDGETILIMFSGIMPFGIVIAKKVKNVKIYGIELNEVAHKYALENVRINKVAHKVYPILGDVREKAKEFFGKCDRILMPLPFSSKEFFELAVKCLKEKGIIHFYTIGEEPNIFEEGEKFLNEKCKKLKVEFRILSKTKVQMYAPRKWKISLDVEIIKSSNSLKNKYER
jgi:tRNA (guanine37-N1)-methyltransferase